MKKSLRRAALGSPVLIALALFAGACGKAQNTGGETQAGGGAVQSSTSSVAKSEKIDDPKASTTSSDKKATTTTQAVTDAQFAPVAWAAFKGKFGDAKALEMKIFFGKQRRADIQIQDPSKPANVDQYEYQGNSISEPAPVKLTGSGKLEDNLFDPSTIAWDKFESMMEQAKSSIGEIEGSEGITHVIIHKNLPFDEDTVVNIYVGGGTRSDGGYVSFKNDGTLKKVYGPSNK